MTSTLARRRRPRPRARQPCQPPPRSPSSPAVPTTAGSDGETGPVDQAEGAAFFGEAAGSVDTIDWGLPYGEPPTVDPANGAFYSASLVSMQMCEPLMRIDETTPCSRCWPSRSTSRTPRRSSTRSATT